MSIDFDTMNELIKLPLIYIFGNDLSRLFIQFKQLIVLDKLIII